jgi:hypothetical protein
MTFNVGRGEGGDLTRLSFERIEILKLCYSSLTKHIGEDHKGSNRSML